MSVLDSFRRLAVALKPRTRDATEGKKPCVREGRRSWLGPRAKIPHERWEFLKAAETAKDPSMTP
jgi:hypothetical protein